MKTEFSYFQDQRRNHVNDVDAIRTIAKHAKIPIICNGGSSDNRNSDSNTHDGIRKFWKESGASSVMIARGAEWNPSIFRAGEKDAVMTMIDKYMEHAINYDYPFNIVKYTTQQLLGSLQNSEMGTNFLNTATMEDVCNVFGHGEKYHSKVEEWAQHKERPDSAFVEKMNTTLREEARKRTIDEVEVTEMFCPFVRGHYGDNDSSRLPKSLLLMWSRQIGEEQPVYTVEQLDKQFRARVEMGGQVFGSTSWEKNKKFAEQGAALVAIKCLKITKDDIKWRQQTGGDDGTQKS